MPASSDKRKQRESHLPQAAGRNGGAPSAALDDDALMLFEDGLRAHLPGADEIIARAAVRKRKARSTCAMLATVLCSAALFWADPVIRSEQIATTVGERSTWTLADGSEVTLNTNSSLRVDTHLRSRQMHLAQGEALFKVEHSRWRSFFVYANHTTVEDIGTVFNVRNTPTGAQVTVLEGRVAVMAEQEPGPPRLLDTNQSVETDGGRLRETREVDADAGALWQNGKLRFDDARLADVVAELQRYRAGRISLSPALADLRITGQFDIARIDQLLAMLPMLAPVTVSRRSDGGVD
ncbi:MAG TPA: FecR domain-containing protein, partial [Oxalicibacterium sp.]|nr:FecR domain-containing protein [Oxalicibacterium sp.]